MFHRLRWPLGVVIGVVSFTAGPRALMSGAAAQQRAESKDPAIVEFTSRVGEYMNVRQKAVSAFKPLKQDAAQAEILRARKGARGGDSHRPGWREAGGHFYTGGRQVFPARDPGGLRAEVAEGEAAPAR